jgi:hypothetical protein
MAKTKKQLVKELKELGVEDFNEEATNAELEALIEENMPEEEPEEEDKEEKPEESKKASGLEKKAPASITPEGMFVVKAFEEGYRMYNPTGVAVSAVVKDPGAINKQCARHNALSRGGKKLGQNN